MLNILKSKDLIAVKLSLRNNEKCEFGEPEETSADIINSYVDHHPKPAFFEVGPLTRAWLQQTELTICYDDERRISI